MKKLESRFNLEILIFPILLLSLVLRVIFLNRVPPGFWFDEASFSYSAYSVLKTGRDEFGNFLPVAFPAFGEYKMALYGYWLIPFVALFGLNVFAVRLSGAVLGVLATLGLFLLASKIFNNKIVGLLSSFIFAISPFALQFNRIVYENNLTTCLTIYGTYFFLKTFEEKKYFFWGLLFHALTFYTHLLSRIFTPLFILLLIAIYRKELLNGGKKRLIELAIVLFLVLLPFLNYLTTPKAWKRAGETALTTDKGIILKINQLRGDHGLKSRFGKVFHNKPIELAKTFLMNYFSHFNPLFLIFEGDPVKIYNTPGIGLIHFWEIPFFVFGTYGLLRKKKRGWIVIGWFLLAFFPAAVTRFVPSASRSFQAAPAMALISGFGVWLFLGLLDGKKYSKAILVVLSLFIVINMAYYFDYYYVHLPKRYPYEWRDGAEEVVNFVKQTKDGYEKIIIDQEGISYVNFLFFLKYPPEEIQKEAVLTEPDEFGFSYIPKFGKYYFVKEMPAELKPGVLYIGRKGDFVEKGEMLKVVQNNKGEDAFFIVTGRKNLENGNET